VCFFVALCIFVDASVLHIHLSSLRVRPYRTDHDLTGDGTNISSTPQDGRLCYPAGLSFSILTPPGSWSPSIPLIVRLAPKFAESLASLLPEPPT